MKSRVLQFGLLVLSSAYEIGERITKALLKSYRNNLNVMKNLEQARIMSIKVFKDALKLLMISENEVTVQECSASIVEIIIWHEIKGTSVLQLFVSFELMFNNE